METEYDLIVIGAGPVGENVAAGAVAGGLSVVIVESELVGGECSYWACMPTKTLLRDASALDAAKGLPGAAAAITGSIDESKVFERRDSFTHHWQSASQVEWLDSTGIDLIRGVGRLSSDKDVSVTLNSGEEVILHARHAVAVCTGTRPTMPDIPGLDKAKVWTNREAVATNSVPKRLAVIGGGVVAVEMASVFSALGSEVTILARHTVLANFEPCAVSRVLDAFNEQGIRVRTNTSPESVSYVESGAAVLSLSNGDQLEVDQVLVAVGRTPNTGDLGLAEVTGGRGPWISVDETLRVVDAASAPIPWLYAVGDVNHRALLTHQGKYQARAAASAIVARARGEEVSEEDWTRAVATADHHAVPQVVFTRPELIAVGQTLAQAERSGASVRYADVEFSDVAGAAVHSDGYTGTARLIIDEDRRTVLGFTAVGPDLAELLHAATIAIVGEIPIDRLWHAVPAYPTMSDVWLRLLEKLGR